MPVLFTGLDLKRILSQCCFVLFQIVAQQQQAAQAAAAAAAGTATGTIVTSIAASGQAVQTVQTATVSGTIPIVSVATAGATQKVVATSGMPIVTAVQVSQGQQQRTQVIYSVIEMRLQYFYVLLLIEFESVMNLLSL